VLPLGDAAQSLVDEMQEPDEGFEAERQADTPSEGEECALAQVNHRCPCPTPQSTIEAIMFCVRERGVAALKELPNIERLLRCDAGARAQINRRIEKLK
jgi:hypothetical protein